MTDAKNDYNVLLEKLLFYGVGRRKLDDPLFARDAPHPRLGTYDEDDEELCHEIIISTCNIPGCGYTTDTLLDFENHYNSAHRYSCSECKKYCCYIQECKEKFKTPEDRMEHCVKEHKIPKDFRYDFRPKPKKNKVKNKTKKVEKPESMDLEEQKSFSFTNSKQKVFPKYTGKKFTKNTQKTNREVNMMEIVSDLRESLPET